MNIEIVFIQKKRKKKTNEFILNCLKKKDFYSNYFKIMNIIKVL